MKKYRPTQYCYLLVFFCCLSAWSRAEASPNVILVLVDDFGCGEHGFYGNQTINTPNLDQLSRASVHLENFIVGPSCSPTRAQLMSGKHEFRVGVTHTKYPRAYMNLGEEIMPEFFKNAGYATGHFGKWHLANDVFDDEYMARHRGFDHSLVAHFEKHFDPSMIENGLIVKKLGFRTDILFEEATQWIAEQNKNNTPFFCYIATISAHVPVACPPGFESMYAGQFENEEVANFYRMVSNVDENMGKLIAFLEEAALFENTVLIYLTDNGSTGPTVFKGEGLYNAGMRGGKSSPYRGGTRVPCLFYGPKYFGEARDIDDLCGAIDMLPTFGALCRLKEKQGVDGISLLPLLTGETQKLQDRFLVSHVGRWKDGAARKSEFEKCAVQNKRYRLVNNQFLFDIERDPGETVNVIDGHPQLVAEMRAFYDRWWKETLPLMINEQRAVDEGGSRIGAEDIEFRKARLK